MIRSSSDVARRMTIHRLGDLLVVVTNNRYQCANPNFKDGRRKLTGPLPSAGEMDIKVHF